MSHDALMRWGCEGGAPAAPNKRDASAHAEPAESTAIRPQPLSRRQRARRATPAAASSTPSGGRRGDDGEG
jgi:hypothetical protein